MSSTSRLWHVTDALVTGARRINHRVGWTWRGWCALFAAFVALGGGIVVLGGVSEDVTQHNGLANSDPSHLRLLVDHRTGFLVRVADIVTNFGNVAVVAIVAIAAAVALWRLGLPTIVAVSPAIALGAAAFLGAVAKRLVDRGRPPASLRLVAEGDSSFPSGHATHGAALYLTLGLVLALFVFRHPLSRIAAASGGVALAGVIGISRLVLGVHWPSDVLAGWALGTIVALSVVIAAALVTRLVAADPTPPPGRLQRPLALLGRVLTHARAARHPRLRAV